MTRTRRSLERYARLRVGSMETLLFLLVMSVFVAPIAAAPGSMMEQVLEDVLLSLILLSGAVAVSERRIAFVLLVLVALVVIVVRWAGWFMPTGMSPNTRAEAMLLGFILLAVVIGIKVFGSGAAIQDRLWGSIAVYMLIGIIWAGAYQVVALYIPGAFTGLGDAHDMKGRWAWIYFSFTTLTTVGYGDVTPVARVARSLSNMEALLGQLYPAIVLARIVSLQGEERARAAGRQASRRGDPPEAPEE
jgi:hypothetical protein